MRNFPGFGRKTAKASLVATLLLPVLPACGGADRQVGGILADAQTSRYAATCQERSAKQAKELGEGAYNPAVVFVHKWPASQADTLLPESRLTAALESGEVKRLTVVARGGLGKSRLGESLRAQLCGAMPTFQVDLKDIAQKPQDALIDAMARDAGVADRAALAKDLADKRFLLLLDSIEEVDLPRRAAVMAEVTRVGKQFPQVQIAMLERPPVLDADYGFSHADAVVEIPPLECKVTQAFLAREFPSGPERLRFEQFLKRFGLDEKAQFGLQCVHPYLSTYRDIQTLAAFEKQALAPEGAARVSPAAVYETLVGARLQKEFAHLGWGQAEALDMVDRLVRMQTSTKGQHSLLFDLAGCAKAIDAKWGTAAVDAGVEGDDAARRRAVCEKTFQSALFQRAQGVDSWVFADRNTTDLFEARWLGGEVARTPAGDCKVISDRGDMLANPGVLRFFAGQPYGQRCLAHTVAALCAKGETAPNLADALDTGLPAGPGRAQALQDARAQATNLGQGPCVTAVLDSLDKTVAH